MAGAFTAVADDATATWWNPAGLASGAYFSLVLERARLEDPDADSPFQGRTGGFAVTFPALGVSYYRIRADEAGPLPIDPPSGGREEGETVESGIRGVAISQYGVTVGQSVTDGFVVATTLKLLRSGQIREHDSTGGLGAAVALDIPVATRFDVDLGVMASFGPLRVGGTLRNLTTPEFGGGGGDLRLDRQVRLGAALVGDRLPWPVNLAVDVDLTEIDTALGDVRHTAAGAEGWLWGRRLGVRGGISVNTAGAGGESASGGLSVMLQSGLHLEGSLTRGSDPSREGWSVGLSVSF